MVSAKLNYNPQGQILGQEELEFILAEGEGSQLEFKRPIKKGVVGTKGFSMRNLWDLLLVKSHIYYKEI